MLESRNCTCPPVPRCCAPFLVTEKIDPRARAYLIVSELSGSTLVHTGKVRVIVDVGLLVTVRTLNWSFTPIIVNARLC